MADAEKKNISRLDFNINDAINSLDLVDKKLKSIAEQSNLYSKQIGKNIGSSFDFSKVLNVDSFSQQLSKVAQISEKDAKKLVANIMKNEQDITAKTKIEQEKRQTAIVQNNAKQLTSEAKTADKIKIIHEETEAFKEKKAYAAALKQEQYNERVAKSTESLYDKITQYAKTYIIYQRFNALKKGMSETIDEMVEVEQQMVAIDRVMNVTGMDINEFRDKLIQMAYDYGNAFENVADVSLRLAQAGIKSENNLKLTEKTLLALNTTELDATQATDDMVAVMSQWNLITDDATKTAKEYGDIIDKVNKVADNFPTTSADILDALKKTSSAFNLAGASIDKTIATIVAAEKASQRGGKVIGTALSNIIQQLKDAGKVDIAESLGISFFADEAKTQYKPIMEIFQSLSDRMQQLKKEGKESSVEMQQLLSVFTVFRRNIGASLLGEMAGEESTYAKVLKTTSEAIGYSMDENTKYMRTAKAAQEQFNTTLLQLKTEIWDNKVENVYRDLLKGGMDFIKWIENLSKDMKLLPAIIGVVAAGFSLLGKKMDANALKKYTVSFKEMQKALEIYNKSTGDGSAKIEKFYKHLGKDTPDAISKYTKGLKGAEASMAGLIANTVTQTAKQLALNLAIAAGEAAISFGLSLAIQGLVTLIGNWINATENAGKAIGEMNTKISDGANEVDSYVDSFKDLKKELASGNLTQEEYNKKTLELKNLEEELIEKYGDKAKALDLVNGLLETQIQKMNDLKKIDYGKYISENYDNIQRVIKDVNNETSKAIDISGIGVSGESFSNAMKSMQDIAKEFNNIDFFSDWLMKVKGTPEEIMNTLVEIQKRLNERLEQENDESTKKALSNELELVSKALRETNEKYSESLKEYEEYLNNKLKYEESYSKIYEKILAARAKVSEASIKGNLPELEKAQKELNDVYKNALEEASKDPVVAEGMTKLIKEQIDNVNEEIEKEKIGIKIGVQGDELFESIQNILNQMGNIDIKSFKTGLENTDIQTQFGNIDILREGITWNEDNIKKYREQLEELNLDINNLVGSYSNILGASKAFETEAGEIEVAYSPMLKTDHGLIPLYQDEVEEYIQEVLNQAQEDISNGKYSNLNEAVLAIDSEGIEDFVNSSGDKIKGLIADVGDTAIETGSKMHENWMKIDEAGGTTEKFRQLKDILDENGISVEELTENFDYLGLSLGDANEKIIESSDNIQYLTESVDKSIEGLANLDSGFSAVYSAMNEFNNQGYISASTLQNLINNDLLQYFDVVNGKLSVNEAAMVNAATAAKAKAIEDLQAQAAAQIAAIAFGEEGSAASAAAGTTGAMTDKTNNVKNALAQMTPEALKAADAWQKLNAAMGASIEGLGEDQIGRINQIMNDLSRSITAVNSVKIESVSYRRASASSGGGGRSSSSSSNSAEAQAKREAEQAAKEAEKAEEEAYKARLKKFKDYMTEKERLETRWVKKQKELGLLSNDDYLYITQQRIERYKKYLDEINKATWMKEEDRLELQKKYTEEIEDLQVDYFDYLKDKLEEDVNNTKESYQKKIDLIKDETDKRIDALRKVDNENDRIRKKEEYEKKRQEHLNDISYWEQRTGREAQEALKEAKKNLQELDEEWQEQLEDWSIDDQIKAIEAERDAQIKATEEAQEAEIKGIEKVYDEKVKKFAETGEIIYEGSTIQSKKLYNQYKTNFIDPITNDLKNLNKAEKKATTTPTPEPKKQEQQYETYLIKRGDTLSAIARRYGTTVDKIMAANPYIKNRNLIYTGNTLQIPKFHEGGIASEGLALLKKNEMILKPEWTPGMLKLMKYIDKNFNTQGQSTSAGNKIQVTRKFSKHTS